MGHDIEATAYGIAAFAILQQLLPKLLANNIVTRTDLLSILDHVAQAESSRGVASDSDADIGAARLAGTLAIAVRHQSKSTD